MHQKLASQLPQCALSDHQEFRLGSLDVSIDFSPDGNGSDLVTLSSASTAEIGHRAVVVESPSSSETEALISQLESLTRGFPGRDHDSYLQGLGLISESLLCDAQANSLLSADAQRLAIVEKPVVRFREIDRASIDSSLYGDARAFTKPLTWIHITGIQESLIPWLEERTGIRERDIRPFLGQTDSASESRFKNYLVVRGNELSLAESADQPATLQPFVAICNHDYFVTMSDSPIKCLERVWNEVASGDALPEEIASSNYLASRIIGASLYAGSETVRVLRGRSERISELARKSEESISKYDIADAIGQSARLARKAQEGYANILDRLSESENYFGVVAPRTSLNRHRDISAVTGEILDQIRDNISDQREAWEAREQKYQSDLLAKITIIGGAVLPVATVASVFGINLSALPSDDIIVGSLYVSAAISAILLGAFWYQHSAVQGKR